MKNDPNRRDTQQRQSQIQLRKFKVIVIDDPELVYSDGKENTFLAFDGWVYGGKTSAVICEVFFDLKLWRRRKKLFQAGHRLGIMARTDNLSPVLYATDAWFDRQRTG